MTQMNLSTKHKLTHRVKPVLAKVEESGRGMEWGFGISRRKLLQTEWINNKVLLYSTGN